MKTNGKNIYNRLFIIRLLILFSFTICNPGLKSQPVTIDLVKGMNTKGSIRMSEIASEIRYVKLETTPECLINRTNLLYNYGGSWIIRTGRMLRFDDDGKFLNVISGRGKGPSEYIELNGIGYNSANKHIYLFNGPTGKAMEFTLDGKFSALVNINCRGMKTILANNHYFVNYCQSRPLGLGMSDGYRFTMVSLDGKPRKQLLKQDIAQYRYEINSFDARLYMYGDSVTCWENISDTVYRISRDFKVTPRYILDLGKEATPLYFKMPTSSPEHSKEVEKYSIISNIIETDHYLLIDIIRKMTYCYVVYRKSDGACFAVDPKVHIENDLDPDCWFWPMGITENGLMYFIAEMTYLKEKFPGKPSTPIPAQTRPSIRNVTENSDENDNPILMIVKTR